jgi:hypothetical protein
MQFAASLQLFIVLGSSSHGDSAFALSWTRWYGFRATIAITLHTKTKPEHYIRSLFEL